MNIIEHGRMLAVQQLFTTSGFISAWPTWKTEIQRQFHSTSSPTNQEILDIGDRLRDIFRTTGQAGRSQSAVSGGGANWEALVCWYLNLCTSNRRTLVIKHNRNLIPKAVNEAITVNYGNFRSNTESDLIAITFPDRPEYSIDKNNISITDSHNQLIPTYKPTRRNPNPPYNYLEILNALVERDFNDLEIHIIQCKTNWNDNAQIPMLWDAIYSASNFRNGISVGTNGKSIQNIYRFTYSFVTVPSNQLLNNNGNPAYNINSTSVLRVANLSGGNYWGLPSQQGVASSIKELVSRNLSSGNRLNALTTIATTIPSLTTSYNYFDLI
ncbi:TPA: hypothetical protein ACGO3I_001145 [Streptococcus suis]